MTLIIIIYTNLTVRNHDTFDVLISSIVMQHAYVCIFHTCSCIEKIWNNITQLNLVASTCSKKILCSGRLKAFLKSGCTRSDCTKSLRVNRTWNTTMHGKYHNVPIPNAHLRMFPFIYSYYLETDLTLTSNNTCQANTWKPPSMGSGCNCIQSRCTSSSHLPSHCWVA